MTSLKSHSKFFSPDQPTNLWPMTSFWTDTFKGQEKFRNCFFFCRFEKGRKSLEIIWASADLENGLEDFRNYLTYCRIDLEKGREIFRNYLSCYRFRKRAWKVSKLFDLASISKKHKKSFETIWASADLRKRQESFWIYFELLPDLEKGKGKFRKYLSQRWFTKITGKLSKLIKLAPIYERDWKVFKKLF